MTIICIREKNSRLFVYVYVRLKKMQCERIGAMRRMQTCHVAENLHLTRRRHAPPEGHQDDCKKYNLAAEEAELPQDRRSAPAPQGKKEQDATPGISPRSTTATPVPNQNNSFPWCYCRSRRHA
jgi:hypothetical protein